MSLIARPKGLSIREWYAYPRLEARSQLPSWLGVAVLGVLGLIVEFMWERLPWQVRIVRKSDVAIADFRPSLLQRDRLSLL